jgi:hypothetical protein
LEGRIKVCRQNKGVKDSVKILNWHIPRFRSLTEAKCRWYENMVQLPLGHNTENNEHKLFAFEQ